MTEAIDNDPNHTNQKRADMDGDHSAGNPALQVIAGNSPEILDCKVDVPRLPELKEGNSTEEHDQVSIHDKPAERVTRHRSCASEPSAVARIHFTDSQSPLRDPRGSSVPVSGGRKGKFLTPLSDSNLKRSLKSPQDASLPNVDAPDSTEIIQLLDFAVDNYCKTMTQNHVFAKKQLYLRSRVRKLLQTNTKFERECRELEAEIERQEYRNGHLRAENEDLESTCTILRSEQERLGAEIEELRQASDMTKSEFGSFRRTSEDSIINLRQETAEKIQKIQETQKHLSAENENVSEHNGQQALPTQRNSKLKRKSAELDVLHNTTSATLRNVGRPTQIQPAHLQPTGNDCVSSAPTLTKKLRQSPFEMRPPGQLHALQLGSLVEPPAKYLQKAPQTPNQTTSSQALQNPRSDFAPSNWSALPPDFKHDLPCAASANQLQSPQNPTSYNPQAPMLPSPNTIMQSFGDDHQVKRPGTASDPFKPGSHHAVPDPRLSQSKHCYQSGSANKDLTERVRLLETIVVVKNGEISLVHARNIKKTEECDTLQIQVNAFREGIQSVTAANEQTVSDMVVQTGHVEQGQGRVHGRVLFEQTNVRNVTLGQHISSLSKVLAKKDAQIITLQQNSSPSPMTKDQFLQGLVQLSSNEPIRSVGDVISSLNRLGTLSTRLAADNTAYKADIASLAVMAIKLIGFRGQTTEEIRDLFRSWLEFLTVQRLMDNTTFMELFQR
ncbi:MAG: hypothetical protein Q9160_000246, partial [Pyrenula sp. 1 TL-2023]